MAPMSIPASNDIARSNLVIDCKTVPAPRTLNERIQLTVALHLYLETIPGPLLDEYIIAQVVYNRVYGMEWVAPAEGLLSNLNNNPNNALAGLYEEVIGNREVWAQKAYEAYLAWARRCWVVGVVPPPAFLGRWW